MGQQDNLGALGRQFLDGRGDALDAGRIRHLAAGDGHVQVNAQQYALAGDIGEIVKCLESRHGEFPVLTVVTVLRGTLHRSRQEARLIGLLPGAIRI